MFGFLSDPEAVLFQGGYVMRGGWEVGIVLGGGMESMLDVCPRVPPLRRSTYQKLQHAIDTRMIFPYIGLFSIGMCLTISLANVLTTTRRSLRNWGQ